MEKFCEKIQYLRAQKGCSQETLAETLKVSRQTISKWELGVSEPDLVMVVALSNFFHVSTDLLLRDDYRVEQAANLDSIAISFLNSAQDMDQVSKELIAILRDGVIDDTERQRLRYLVEKIDDIMAVASDLRNMLSCTQSM